VLCLPIIGIMDSERGAQMMGEILTAVAEKRASQVIIDLTGIDTMDSETLNQLVATAKAIRLLGTECVLTGIRPAVARTLVALQFGGSVETTLRSVREALTRIVRRRPAP
jgi:rsbT co-antagonist protein RsbR